MFGEFWILWAVFGLIVAIGLFYWSIRTRQFEDSKKASLLPFDDITPEPARGGSNTSLTVIVVLISLFTVITLAVMLIIAMGA